MDATPESVQEQLERVLAGEALSKSATNRRLLAYLVHRSQASADGPKELEIAIDVFGRDARFNGGEDSVVRVAVRALRQKLLEHYSGTGRGDPLVFDIPKGAYRLTVTARAQGDAPVDPAPHAVADPAGNAPNAHVQGPGADHRLRRWKVAAALLLGALAVSVGFQASQRFAPAAASDSAMEQLRRNPIWSPIASSRRPLMFVLGDLFMFTQTDPTTGRTLTVRDPQIQSSDDLRAFLAGNPELSAERGLRYASMLQKSTAVSTVEILRLLGNPARRVEVRLRDELRAEDLRNYDIIYVGPISRLGPLASDHHVQSRYRFDTGTASITDVSTGMTYAPEGDLGDHRKDYALVSRFAGPAGNSIMVFTSGGRNAGLLQVVRTLTTPEGLRRFQGKEDAAMNLPPAFEALLSVSGYKQTDLGAELIQLHALTATPIAIAATPP